MEPIELPTHLDDPKTFLIFSMDDVLIVGVAMIIGLATHLLGYLLILALIMMWVMRRFRGSVPDGHLQHRLYWYGIPLGGGHSLINPLIRRFVG